MKSKTYTYSIIEDVEDVILGIKKRMENYEQWENVGNSREIESAIEIVSKNQPHLLFMDWNIKGGSTYEVLEYIKKTEGYNPYVIYFTGFQKDEPSIPMNIHNKYEVDKYLIKPIWKTLSKNLDKYLKEAIQKNNDNRQISITDIHQNVHIINPGDIAVICVFCSEKRTKAIQLVCGKQIVIKKTFPSIEKLLKLFNIDYIYTNKRYSIVCKRNIGKLKEGYIFFHGNKCPKVEVSKENLKKVTRWLKGSSTF